MSFNRADLYHGGFAYRNASIVLRETVAQPFALSRVSKLCSRGISFGIAFDPFKNLKNSLHTFQDNLHHHLELKKNSDGKVALTALVTVALGKQRQPIRDGN